MTTTATISTADVTPHLATTEVIFSKLLVAIDFRAQAKEVLKTAAEVARCFNAEMLLVHALTPVVDGRGAETIYANSYVANLEAARVKLSELVAGEPALQFVRHREIVRYGEPVELAEQAVRTHKVDLVIAGSHGGRGLERLALGSVGEAILRHVNCPALIVGPNATNFDYPCRSVLLASKLDLVGLRAAQYASGLAEKFHGKLTLLHVIEKTTIHIGERELFEQAVQNELMSLVPSDLDSYSKAEVHVTYGKPGEAITFIAQEESASMIVCGVRESAPLADHTLASTLAQVIRKAHCPVLCIRPHSTSTT